MNTMNLGDKSSPSVKEFKPKLYNAMDVDPEPDSEPKPDKGKGVDKGPRSRSSSPIMGEQEQGSGTRSPSPILSAEVGGPQFILNDLRHELGISDGNIRIRINKLRRELYFLYFKNEDISKISDELLKLEALRDRVYKRGSVAALELHKALDAIGETNSFFHKLAYEASYPIQNSEPSGSLNNTRSSVSSSQSDKDLAEAIALSLQSLDSDKNEPGEGSSKK
uniref:Uncharacterized protein n=1 Tax=Rhynchobrunnera orthospora TaxID=210010 RepID=V5W5W5_9HELO|nr:hypothetical protein [Rhynchobrunnera orthospora]AHC02403.1 hypothetical protein [Rhynchobrunnera orthospora]